MTNKMATNVPQSPSGDIQSSTPFTFPQRNNTVIREGRRRIERRKTLEQKPNTRSERKFNGFNPYIGTDDRRVHLFETYVGKAPVGTTGRDLIAYRRGNRLYHAFTRRENIRRVSIVSGRVRNRILPMEVSSPDMVNLTNGVVPTLGGKQSTITSSSAEPKFLSSSLLSGSNFAIAIVVLLFLFAGRS